MLGSTGKKKKKKHLLIFYFDSIANMCQTKTLPSQHQILTKTLIPMIIRLFSEEPTSVDAPLVLGIVPFFGVCSHISAARLVGYNEDLQVIATEAEAVPKLGNLLQATTNERLREVFNNVN